MLLAAIQGFKFEIWILRTPGGPRIKLSCVPLALPEVQP